MASSLSDLFDGAESENATSDSQAITAGLHALIVQGTADGAQILIQYNNFDSNWDTLDPELTVADTGVILFRCPAGNVRAVLSNAGASTSLKAGILAAQ